MRAEHRARRRSRIGYRATLCRCGASKNKPFCDGSHHEIGFAATGEPPTGDKPTCSRSATARSRSIRRPTARSQVRGNLEIISGTGRVVARVQSAKLCRCGGSANKPFCDGTHQKIGFRIRPLADQSFRGPALFRSEIAADFHYKGTCKPAQTVT